MLIPEAGQRAPSPSNDAGTMLEMPANKAVAASGSSLTPTQRAGDRVPLTADVAVLRAKSALADGPTRSAGSGSISRWVEAGRFWEGFHASSTGKSHRTSCISVMDSVCTDFKVSSGGSGGCESRQPRDQTL